MAEFFGAQLSAIALTQGAIKINGLPHFPQALTAFRHIAEASRLAREYVGRYEPGSLSVGA